MAAAVIDATTKLAGKAVEGGIANARAHQASTTPIAIIAAWLTVASVT